MKNAPRVFLYGMANFRRAGIPEILADFEALPKDDERAFPDGSQEEYEEKLEAYRQVVMEPDERCAEIHRLTGV